MICFVGWGWWGEDRIQFSFPQFYEWKGNISIGFIYNWYVFGWIVLGQLVIYMLMMCDVLDMMYWLPKRIRIKKAPGLETTCRRQCSNGVITDYNLPHGASWLCPYRIHAAFLCCRNQLRSTGMPLIWQYITKFECPEQLLHYSTLPLSFIFPLSDKELLHLNYTGYNQPKPMAESHRRSSQSGSVAEKSPIKEPPPPQPENERDWSALPPEMLHLITKKLPDLPDLVRFRVVCQNWRSASSVSDPPPQLPWYIKNPCEYPDENPDPEKKYLHLHSMISGKIPKIKVPESHGKELHGSAHRYLLAFDWEQSSLSLLNPLTRREISLPPLKLASCELLCVRSDPSGSGIFVAIDGSVERSGPDILASCRVGDGNWVTVEQSKLLCCRTYYKGMFYVHDRETSITEVIDATTGRIVHVIPPQEYTAANSKPTNAKLSFHFLVESGGDLLGISGIWGTLDTDPAEYCFVIHRLDGGNGNPRWVPTKSIGNRFIFLHDSSVSFDASDFPGLKGNSIYFVTF
ncbi:hypothetical protein LUZ61_010532 [Rhynchospora tenuis]|uniref:F-box domain-containing protein n=1 Tax=Rhynchospora tenuis TaxID=198213 RepID=A0AAD6EZC2_9POAL|nr:hypothetical protein LUZ61_010532 [Rhynchospora tenuis]